MDNPCEHTCDPHDEESYVLEENASDILPGSDALSIHVNEKPETALLNEVTLSSSANKVDDVNPAVITRSPFEGKGVDKPRNPSGMLMGPDDPFFSETRVNLGVPVRDNVRYDIIGPFGQEPDPDIEMPRGGMRLPRRGDDFGYPKGNFFPGGGSHSGGFF